MIELVMICVTVMVVVATVCNTAIEIYKIKKKPTISYEFLGGKSNSENVNLEE